VPKSLKCKLSVLRHQGRITDEEYKDLLEKLKGHDMELLKNCNVPDKNVGKWIPVSERLPKLYTFVYATCHSLVDDREDWVIETCYVPIPKEYNPRRFSDWGNIPMLNYGEAEVIAWMKRDIPEPYKEVEE